MRESMLALSFSLLWTLLPSSSIKSGFSTLFLPLPLCLMGEYAKGYINFNS